MTTPTDIANRALQVIGTRTTVTDGELVANSTNCLQFRSTLPTTQLEAADPDGSVELCVANGESGVYYVLQAPQRTLQPRKSDSLWVPGLPSPPWTYEYQYPVDCIYAAWIPAMSCWLWRWHSRRLSSGSDRYWLSSDR